MRVFVNAVSVREGGPWVVLVKLLAAMRCERPDMQICVAALPAMCDELQHSVTTRHPVTIGQSPFAIAKWYEFDLPAAARKWSADVVFSVTNYLPLRRLSIPTLLLEQHAGHFSPTFERLMYSESPSVRERLAWRPKQWWVRRSVETATVLTVQTAALADAVAGATRVSRDRICVIPHGPGWVQTLTEPPAIVRDAATIRIGYISKLGVQKNFATLFNAVKQLSDQGRSVRLVLTLDSADILAAATFAAAKAVGIAHLIENHGEIAANAIADLYDGLDIFVFPSLCESFGMPMVEAMARGLCIVVADTPENREMVGTAGTVFSALDADQLATVLGRLCDDKEERRANARKSLNRARDFSWQKAAQGTLAALDVAVASHVG